MTSNPRNDTTSRLRGTPYRALLERHRTIWSNKASLRRIYEGYVRTIQENCTAHGPTVELGSGPGFFKAFAPQTIATDVEPAPWIDLVVNGCTLPFKNESIGNLVMLDVFHHIARPARFLAEAARVLKIGGRIVMLEPWTSPLGYLFYRYVHHERADRCVNPFAPFRNARAAFEGNAALPKLYFDRNAFLGRVVCRKDRLRINAVRLHPSAGWLLSGGFRPHGLLPASLVPLATGLDRLLQPIASLCALRALVVIERVGAAAKSRPAHEVLPALADDLAATAFDGPRSS